MGTDFERDREGAREGDRDRDTSTGTDTGRQGQRGPSEWETPAGGGTAMVAAANAPPMSAQASAGLAIIFKALEQQKNGIKKFRTLDLDGTGELSAFEFKKAVRAIATNGGGDVALSPGQWHAVIKEMGGESISIQRFLDRAFIAKIEQVRRQIKAASLTTEGMNWQKLFEETDTDGSGALDLPEFIHMLRRKVRLLPDQVSDEDIEQIVLFMDDDRNGQVECQEFLNFLNQEDLSVSGESTTMKVAASVNAALHKSGARMLDVFNRVDRLSGSGSGELDEDKFYEALVTMGAYTTKSEVTLLMAAVDTDGGGTITADEFLHFLKKAKGAAPERKPKKHKFEGDLSYKRWGGPGLDEHEVAAPRVTRQSRQVGADYAKQVVANLRASEPSTKWSPPKALAVPPHLPRVFAQMQTGPSPYSQLPPSSSDVALRTCDMRLLESDTVKGNRSSTGTTAAKSEPKKMKNKKIKTANKKELHPPIASNHSFTSYDSGQEFVSVAKDPSMVGVNKMLRQRALQEELSEPTAQKVALNALADFARDSLISPAEHKRISQAYLRPSKAMRASVKTRKGLIDGWSSQQHSLAENAEARRARVGEKVAGLRHELQRNRNVLSEGSLASFTPSPPSTARPATDISGSPRPGLSPRQLGLKGGRCGPNARPLTAPMEFGTASFLGSARSDLPARVGDLPSLHSADSLTAAEKETSRKRELEMAITKLRAEAAIEHGTARGLIDQLSQLNARAVPEPDARTCSTPVPLAPPESAEQAALVQLKANLEEYVAEQRAIAARTREAVQKEIEKQAGGLTSVETAARVLDTKSAEAKVAGPKASRKA